MMHSTPTVPPGTPMMHSSTTVTPGAPMMNSSTTVPPGTPTMHTPPTVFPFTPMMHSSTTVTPGASMMHSTPTVPPGTPMMHSSTTVTPGAPMMHSSTTVTPGAPTMHTPPTVFPGASVMHTTPTVSPGASMMFTSPAMSPCVPATYVRPPTPLVNPVMSACPITASFTPIMTDSAPTGPPVATITPMGYLGPPTPPGDPMIFYVAPNVLPMSLTPEKAPDLMPLPEDGENHDYSILKHAIGHYSITDNDPEPQCQCDGCKSYFGTTPRSLFTLHWFPSPHGESIKSKDIYSLEGYQFTGASQKDRGNDLTLPPQYLNNMHKVSSVITKNNVRYSTDIYPPEEYFAVPSETELKDYSPLPYESHISLENGNCIPQEYSAPNNKSNYSPGKSNLTPPVASAQEKNMDACIHEFWKSLYSLEEYSFTSWENDSNSSEHLNHLDNVSNRIVFSSPSGQNGSTTSNYFDKLDGLSSHPRPAQIEPSIIPENRVRLGEICLWKTHSPPENNSPAPMPFKDYHVTIENSSILPHSLQSLLEEMPRHIPDHHHVEKNGFAPWIGSSNRSNGKVSYTMRQNPLPHGLQSPLEETPRHVKDHHHAEKNGFAPWISSSNGSSGKATYTMRQNPYYLQSEE